MNKSYIKDPKSWSDEYRTGRLYTIFEQMSGTSVYQNKCKFCHKTDDFTDMSGLSKGIEEDYVRIWDDSFKKFLQDGDFTNPKEIKHGAPDGISVMIWREGKQKQSAILANLRRSGPFGLGVSVHGILTEFEFCPVCGRYLGGDSE